MAGLVGGATYLHCLQPVLVFGAVARSARGRFGRAMTSTLGPGVFFYRSAQVGSVSQYRLTARWMGTGSARWGKRLLFYLGLGCPLEDTKLGGRGLLLLLLLLLLL